MKKLIRFVHVAEDSLLIILLVSMILLASGQILLRNFFDIGVVWIDPLLRVLVLWSGLLGATVASRSNKHIRIDLISHFFSKPVHLYIQVAIGLFTATICGIIAWHGARWVTMDFEDNITAFSGIPAWSLEVIIPVAFGLIALRYFGLSVTWGMMIWRKQYNMDLT